MFIPDYNDVLTASYRINNYIHKTPIITCKTINDILSSKVYFKCENFQKVGAFKFRGATNAVLTLTEEEAAKGVATHSSGNHAQALALAAKNRAITATIVMPDNSPQVKKDAVAGYGAEIRFCEPTLQAREETLAKVIEEKGCTFIHPYDNPHVIAGQGTAAKEMIEEIDSLDYVIAPVGGGGLLSGSSITTRALSKVTKVIAAEPKGADDAQRSFKSGDLIPSVKPNTICDGLLTSLSDRTFTIIKNNVDDIITVDDTIIIKAMRLVWERMKIIIEPSSAVVLAVLIDNKEKFKNSNIGVIISGGNVDLNKLPWN